MKTTGILLLILLFLPFLSIAGDIYGTIKGDDGKPLINQVVQITFYCSINISCN